jgi:1,2-phenylacetyl-CoA epoxidase catalytic subunit
MSESAPDPFAEAAYREAIIDLLGAMAYGELTAFSRLAGDAELAPTLEGKAALARMAVS